MRRTGIALLDNRATRTSLHHKLAGAGLPLNIVDKLIKLEQEHIGKALRHGMMRQFDEVFSDALNNEADETAEKVSSHVHPIHPTP